MLGANKSHKVNYIPADGEWYSYMIIAGLLLLPLVTSVALQGKEEKGAIPFEERFLNFSSGELLYSISRKACSCFGTGLTYILSNRTILSWCMK